MEQQREQSEYNGAFNYNARLDIIFYEIKQNRESYNLKSWIDSLNSLFMELSTWMKKDGELEKFRGMINRLYSLANKKTKRGGIPADVFNEAATLELELHRIYKEAGLEAKSKEDPRFALHG